MADKNIALTVRLSWSRTAVLYPSVHDDGTCTCESCNRPPTRVVAMAYGMLIAYCSECAESILVAPWNKGAVLLGNVVKEADRG